MYNRVAYDNDLYVIKKIVYCAHIHNRSSCARARGNTPNAVHSSSPAAKSCAHSSIGISSSSVHLKLFILVCKPSHPLSTDQTQSGGNKNVFGVFHPEYNVFFKGLDFPANGASTMRRVRRAWWICTLRININVYTYYMLLMLYYRRDSRTVGWIML